MAVLFFLTEISWSHQTYQTKTSNKLIFLVPSWTAIRGNKAASLKFHGFSWHHSLGLSKLQDEEMDSLENPTSVDRPQFLGRWWWQENHFPAEWLLFLRQWEWFSCIVFAGWNDDGSLVCVCVCVWYCIFGTHLYRIGWEHWKWNVHMCVQFRMLPHHSTSAKSHWRYLTRFIDNQHQSTQSDFQPHVSQCAWRWEIGRNTHEP